MSGLVRVLLDRRSDGLWAGVPALVAEGESIDYHELADRVERLGFGLSRLSLSDETVVALALGRSADHVVGCLGCWHSGAAFLPLDTAWPDERLRFVLDEARPALVLTTRGQLDRFRGLGFAARLPRDVEDVPLGTVAPADRPGRLAYVIYTSGSTGRPKGVEVTHANIMPLLAAQTDAFRLDGTARCLWLLSPAFDASISDWGTSLLAGAALYVEDDPFDDLPRVLRERRITHVDLPPSLLPLLKPEQMPDSLRTLVIGGEPSPPALVRQWAARFRVVNVYGPTEATICTSLCVCDPVKWTEPLLGDELPGVTYAVLNERGNFVPPGEVGELYIGGRCLARGYRDPELTARKFIAWPGGRWFRTGDRVRRRGHDQFVFLGRSDRLIKYRGILIEPAELEAPLLDLAGVAEAVVTGRDGALLAFVAGPGVPADAEMRSRLARTLPRSMQPRRFVRLPCLPRTTSGKIDFDLLSRWPVEPEPPPTAEGPLGVLLALVHELLGTAPDPAVGFLDQGGDSLGLLRLVAMASARGLGVSPAVLASRPLADAVAPAAADAPPGAMPVAALRADVERLAEAVRNGRTNLAPDAPPAKPGRVLLTGATGFFGAHLLLELLRQTEAEVVCLVRASGSRVGQDRLWQSLAARGLSLRTEERRRVGVIAGDLLELAGLHHPELDAVYHAAANVNLVRPYVDLCRDNVAGTAEVLRLCGTGRPKWLHLVSTLSVFVATDRNAGTAREDDDLSRTRWVAGGYAQSKFAAEWLARRAAARGVTYYRPGLVTPDTRGGAMPPRDLLGLFLRGVAKLGCLPACDREALRLDVTPADYAARAVVRLSLAAAGRPPDTFHVAGRAVSLAELAAALASAGVALGEVSAEEWRSRLAALEGEDAAAWLALCRALPAEAYDRCRTLDLFQAGGATFDTSRTREGLAGSNVEPPAVEASLLAAYARAALG